MHPFSVSGVCLFDIDLGILYTHTHVILLYFKQIYDNERITCFFFSSSSSVCLTSLFFLFILLQWKMENGEYVAFKCIITVLFSMCNTRTSNRFCFGYICNIFAREKKSSNNLLVSNM